MKAIVSRQLASGSYAEVGMNDRVVISGIKTRRGILMRAARFARGPHRVELFQDDRFYAEPLAVLYCAGGTGGTKGTV